MSFLMWWFLVGFISGVIGLTVERIERGKIQVGHLLIWLPGFTIAGFISGIILIIMLMYEIKNNKKIKEFLDKDLF